MLTKIMDLLLDSALPTIVRFHVSLNDTIVASGPLGSFWDPATDRVFQVEIPALEQLLESGWLPIGEFTRASCLIALYEAATERRVQIEGITLILNLPAQGRFAACQLGVAIHASPRVPGGWQASYFDARGFYSQVQHATAVAAVCAAMARGYGTDCAGDGDDLLVDVFHSPLAA